ncbi:MAG: hypothetical protein KGL53_10520, partial [Elusimicrobia bacterium]|nr:hypothetical protein [Elusimicrobiota bacterium]
MLERLKTSCPKDVRWFHACFCTSFLGMGLLALGFSISVPRIGLIFAVGLATQFAFLTARKLKVGYMSAIISCISLSLLLRGDRWWVFALAPLAA